MRQREYDNAALYTDSEAEHAAQNERSQCNFISYFNEVADKRHRNSLESINVNWRRVYELMKIFAGGDTLTFGQINLGLIENFKLFLLNAPQGGGKSGTVSAEYSSDILRHIQGRTETSICGWLSNVRLGCKGERHS